ncbi:MAG: antitoxin MazE5 [bacterium]|nr:antitoxin MazE5 [bacterium]
MNRHRISTTVDGRLLASARESMPGTRDARLMDEALAALCRERRRAEIDEQYEAYDSVPLDAPDAWGDVESFLRARRRR